MPSDRGRKGVFHQIFALAAQLEPDRPRVWHWLFNTPIPALDSLTPVELVYAGRGDSVIHLLELAFETNLLSPCCGQFGIYVLQIILYQAAPGSASSL